MSRLMTKPTMWLCAQRRLRSAWASTQSDQSLHCPLGSLAPHWAHSEDSDQTGRMPRLIWVFAGRTVILLVLSWGGPIIINVFFQTEQVPAELTKAKSLSSLSPLTLKVVGSPQMTYQQRSHGITFPCLLLPSGNFRPHSCPFFDVTCIFTTLFFLSSLLLFLNHFIWFSITESWEYGTYRIGDQRRLRRSAQSGQSLRCSHTWSMKVDEGCNQKSDI